MSRRCEQRRRLVVCLAVRASAPFGLAANVKQHRAAARPVTGFDVVEDVADQPGAFEVDPQVTCCIDQQTWCWLAALARHRIFRDGTLRKVRTPVPASESDTFRLEYPAERRTQVIKRRRLEQTA